MSFEAKIAADSVTARGDRLTTMVLTYPRIIHAELMTHRVFSRNSASTRAIPIARQITNLLQNPFIPEAFGVNKSGMQSEKDLTGIKHEQAVDRWLTGLARSVTSVIELTLGADMAGELLGYDPNKEFVPFAKLRDKCDDIVAALPTSQQEIDMTTSPMLNIHKQLAGRGLEAYMWHTVIVTATEWDNFFTLRDHPEAQREIATIARMMKDAYYASQPRYVPAGSWHLPLVDEGEFENIDDAIKSSVARCAAVSYNRHDKKNHEGEKKRYNDLLVFSHMSPLEHQATPFYEEEWFIRSTVEETLDQALNKIHEFAVENGSYFSREAVYRDMSHGIEFSGNFRGWRQHRKFITNEENFGVLVSSKG